MAEPAEKIEEGGADERHGLDDLISQEEFSEQEQQRQQAEQEEQAAQPSDREMEKARIMAERMNGVFLWSVQNMVCPSVPVDEVADREKGNEAFIPLAMAMGGELPPWLQALITQFSPYIGAGVYMGATIITASKVEKAIQDEKQAREKAERENVGGGMHGTQ